LYFPERKDEKNWTLFKTVDSIKIDAEDKAIINCFSHYERQTDKGLIKYALKKNGLLLDINTKAEILLSLDMREIFDFDDKGRIYSISEERGCIIIEYKKYFEYELKTLNYTRYLAIKTDIREYDKICKWTEETFKEDESRKSSPWKLFTFDSIKFNCTKKSRLAISFSDNRNDAVQKANDLFLEQNGNGFEMKKVDSTLENAFAYNCAIKSMEDLYVKFEAAEGFYAGLPWFFQFWTRDEAISLKSMILLEKFDLAKSILLTKIADLADDGRVQNRIPFSELETADGTLWVFRRLLDLILVLQDKKKPLEEYLSKKDLVFISDQLKKTIEGHIKYHSNNMLISNLANETWMDTSYNGDTRAGYRIEIQALFLSVLSFKSIIDSMIYGKSQYAELEEKTRIAVKNAFFDKGILKDGKDDSTLRPNIFLAYYIYPKLLSSEEWTAVFDNSLLRLYLPWGGVATIDKTSSLFCPSYTGEDNKSYHRGDSWFFINNIAAVCLFRLNKDRYKNQIEKIISASANDILYKGIIGRPSELSSALIQSADASLFQLWSAATLIELIYECSSSK
jgi:glycogen debranching enzyme